MRFRGGIGHAIQPRLIAAGETVGTQHRSSRPSFHEQPLLGLPILGPETGPGGGPAAADHRDDGRGGRRAGAGARGERRVQRLAEPRPPSVA